MFVFLPLSAGKAKKKDGVFHRPDTNEVILVGKIIVQADFDKDFIAKSRLLTQKELDSPNVHTAPIFNKNSNFRYDISMSKALKEVDRFRDGEYFYMTYEIPKDRYIELKYLLYYFMSTPKLCTIIPLAINFYVPEGVNALYLGDFSYNVKEKNDFYASETAVSYNIEKAQKFLDEETDHYELVKADWKRNRHSRIIDYTKVTGSPDNSVIFYGGFGRDLKAKTNYYIFSEVSPIILHPDQASKETKFFVSEPVSPGSVYVLRTWRDYNCYNFYFNEQNSPLTVKIPVEPGLYYFGFYDAFNSIEKQKPVKLDSNSKALRREALEAVLECYKGTEWEDYIRKELEKN
ncbi:MAG: hypothetical protein IJ828_12070 [Treponema sp.]|nr:hypothetical protein [Treponema sp.]